MDSRHLLFLMSGSSGEEALTPDADVALPAIAAAGWQVHRAPDAHSARALLEQYPIGVGLARLDSYPHEQFRRDMAVLCRTDEHMSWVALLPPNARDDLEICRFVWETFYDYHTLPPDIDRLVNTLGHAYGMAMLARAASKSTPHDLEEPQMVGVCPAMQAVFRNIRKLAAVDAPVLITAESGTGKELAARAIHERSRRSSGPFIAVNCAALPASLIQSELFGHEKGAFTGAHQRKIGSIEAASGGTLFLDEIGDLSLELQVNLLRFLEENTIQRVGSHKEIPIDVSVIAATHADIEKAVAQGRFREDLYFRMNVLRLEIPPLRARGGDIEVLAEFCFDKFRRENSHNVKGFSPAALEAMAGYAWPGNVRELINRVRRATVMCEGRLIKPSDLGLAARPQPTHLMTLEEVRAAAEKEVIIHALQQTRSLSQAARALGTSRPRLYRLIARYGLSS